VTIKPLSRKSLTATLDGTAVQQYETPHITSQKVVGMLKGIQFAVIVTAGALLLAVGNAMITGKTIKGDARQTVQLALSLQRHGIMSLDTAPPRQPSMEREPVPVLMVAATLAVTDRVAGRANMDQYLIGDRVKNLKRVDLFWLAIIYVSAFWALTLFIESFAVRLGGAVLACIPILVESLKSNAALEAMYSDVGAAAMLLVASSTCVVAARRRTSWGFLCAGACFGLLALIKASVMYVFVGVIAAFAAYLLLDGKRSPVGHIAKVSMALLIGFAVVVAPWMVRNHQHFGVYQIAERGGQVLMIRATKNMMTPEEYLGSFYFWAPHGRFIIGPILGFTPDDLNKRGGRLQHLNRENQSDFNLDDRAAERAGQPEKAVSYYRRARAEWRRMILECTAEGAQYPSLCADKELKKRALALIVQHPFRHLAMTIPFLWRGALFASASLAGALCLAWRRRSLDFGLFLMPALGLTMFYALFSHFIPRYGEPLIPTTMVALVVSITMLRRAPAVGGAAIPSPG